MISLDGWLLPLTRLIPFVLPGIFPLSASSIRTPRNSHLHIHVQQDIKAAYALVLPKDFQLSSTYNRMLEQRLHSYHPRISSSYPRTTGR